MDRTFVRFTGTLWESEEFTRGTGWETTRIARRPRVDAESPYRLRLVDDAVTILVEVPIERRIDGCRRRESEGIDRQQVVGYLPVHPAGRAILLVLGERVLYRAELASARPTVAITELHVGADGQMEIQWEANHDLSLSFNVLFVDGRRRAIPIADGLREQRFTLKTSDLPGGRGCAVAILATDGLRSSVARSDPFDLPERPPRVVILSPRADDSLPPDQPLSLVGFALDAAGRDLSDDHLMWRVDGQPIAEGQRLAVTAPLPPGAHEIELIYRRADNEVARAAARVAVAERCPVQEEWLRISGEFARTRRCVSFRRLRKQAVAPVPAR